MRPSLEQAMADHGKSVFAVAFSLLRCREDAEDVAQETFLRYFTTDKQFESAAHLRAWLLRVAKNLAMDLLRSPRRRELPLEEADGPAFPSEESEALFRAVMALPEAYRLTVHLFYYEDYSVQEIAKVLGLPQTTVRTRLFRGRRLLRQALEEETL